MKQIKKIHIFGASGSGVSTLGSALSKKLGFKWFDSDEFYWKKTDPPFTEAYPVEKRKALIKKHTSKYDSWVVSGTLVSWGSEIQEEFDLAIYLYTSPDERVKRVKKREATRFGNRIMKGGDMYEGHKNFIEWVAQYDEGRLGGRSKFKHFNWMKSLTCPVYKIESNITTEELLYKVQTFIAK